jgi:hypothetical protein
MIPEFHSGPVPETVALYNTPRNKKQPRGGKLRPWESKMKTELTSAFDLFPGPRLNRLKGPVK